MLSIDEEVLAPASPQASEQSADGTSPTLPSAPSFSPSPMPFRLPKASRRPVLLSGEDAGRLVIHAIRQETGLSLRQIAERVGVSRQAIESYQYRHRNPSIRWLGRVVEAVGGRVVIEFPPV